MSITQSGNAKNRQRAARRRSSPRQGVRPRRERVESKEDSIIAAAYEMFVARGFSRTTTADIATAAGVAEGTLYLYFNNKDALAQAVLSAFYRRLTDTAKAGIEKQQTTREKLRFLARHHLKNIIKARRLLEVLATLDLESYEGSEIYSMNRVYVSVFDEVVREGLWRGEIGNSTEPWILRDIFFGGLDYSMRTLFIRKESKAVETVVDGTVALIIGAASVSENPRDDGSEALERVATRLEAAAIRIEKAAAGGGKKDG